MNNPFEELEEFNLSAEVVEKLKDPSYLRRELAEGKSFQEIFNYSEDVMAEFYRAAYQLFQKQQYKEAADAFFFLTNLNSYIPAYWLGLGMSEHLNHEHASALIAYGMASLTDPENPTPHYHAAACYKEIHDFENALASYDLAIAVADDHEIFSQIKQQAEIGKAQLLKQKYF